MNRVHRLMRNVHLRRTERLSRAPYARGYESIPECEVFEKDLQDVRRDRLFDPESLRPAMLKLAYITSTEIRLDLQGDEIGVLLGRKLAVAAYETRSREGTGFRAGGSDRYIAEGCAALAETAIIDRVFRAFGEAMRRRALIDHREHLCWPEHLSNMPSIVTN